MHDFESQIYWLNSLSAKSHSDSKNISSVMDWTLPKFMFFHHNNSQYVEQHGTWTKPTGA